MPWLTAAVLAERLTAACDKGELPAVRAALADGANVNEAGLILGSSILRSLPLDSALQQQLYRATAEKHTAAVLMLAHGADPNSRSIMSTACFWATGALFKIVVAAGGDVNRVSGGRPPLFNAVEARNEETARALLEDPRVDLATLHTGMSAEEYARDRNRPGIEVEIAREVRRSLAQ